ncbi:MAG: CDP-diacylglycerol--serine O-phosphatidyltransferase [Spirochaetes bacterium]|nr:CDP-diacylglycerol--serine O-phosphatidyltransferase [Spirochaetota bacterium]
MTLVWIPNSLTLGNLLLGFISLIYSSLGNQQGFFIAGILVLAASLLDGFDGAVARALKVSSPLGKELDSLADCVAFGIAPGYLSYQAYLSTINLHLFDVNINAGMLIAAFFPICVAYRLARFNINSEPGSFTGLPSPLAGIIIALIHIYNINLPLIAFVAIYILIALLMVSTVRYPKPNPATIMTIHKIKLLIFGIILILLFIFFKAWAVFIIIFIYLMSGILSFVIQFIQEHKY